MKINSEQVLYIESPFFGVNLLVIIKTGACKMAALHGIDAKYFIGAFYTLAALAIVAAVEYRKYV